MELCKQTSGKAALFSIGILCISFNVQAAVTEFKATIAIESGCEISAPDTVTFNNGEALLPADIEGQIQTAKKDFELTLANCKGKGMTPKIIITGESNTDTGKALFLDSSASSATGYGILLTTNGNTVFDANDNIAETKLLSTKDDWDKNTSLTTINGTIPISAIVSCGNCSTNGQEGGDLKANITFDFQYD